MKPKFEFGTKVMGTHNDVFAGGYNETLPFHGEVLYFNAYDRIYDVKVEDRGFPLRIHHNHMTLYIKEIYDKAVECYNTSKQLKQESLEQITKMETLLEPA